MFDSACTSASYHSKASALSACGTSSQCTDTACFMRWRRGSHLLRQNVWTNYDGILSKGDPLHATSLRARAISVHPVSSHILYCLADCNMYDLVLIGAIAPPRHAGCLLGTACRCPLLGCYTWTVCCQVGKRLSLPQALHPGYHRKRRWDYVIHISGAWDIDDGTINSKRGFKFSFFLKRHSRPKLMPYIPTPLRKHFRAL